jgi:hypothetical protein
MGTLAITIETPPVGRLEEGRADASHPSDDEMREEQAARDNVVKSLVEFLETLPHRPPRRQGNVTGFELLGAGTWSKLNNYLLLLTVDIGGGNLAGELAAVLPDGSSVAVVGNYASLHASSANTPTLT